MSTGTKRPLARAKHDAEDFRAMFTGCFAAWEIAGSVRRGKPEVGDCEHVARPLYATTPSDGLFAQPVQVNAIWQRLDEMCKAQVLAPAVYTDKNGKVSQRWGEKYRGITFRDFTHEIFLADADNWGAQLLIRTGPPDYSRNVVDKLRTDGMYRQVDGHLICVASGDRVPVESEEAYVRLAGLPYLPPERRA